MAIDPKPSGNWSIMGLQQSIRFASGVEPAWPAVATALNERGLNFTLRMIDGLPAFPDETPEPGWQEIRLGFDAGMVTIRRTTVGEWTTVIWGNADPALILIARECSDAISAMARA